jgi:hypothetical protein
MRSGPCSQGTESDPDFTPLPLSANQYLETKTLYFATITLQKSGIALVLCRCPYRCVVFKYRLEARVCDKCLIQPSFGKSCDWEIGTELSFRSLKRVRPRFFYPPTIMIGPAFRPSFAFDFNFFHLPLFGHVNTPVAKSLSNFITLPNLR